MEKLELEKESQAEQAVVERKKDTLQLVARVVKRELAEENAKVEKEIDRVNDSDDIDPEADHNAWQLRELQRIQRDRQELEE